MDMTIWAYALELANVSIPRAVQDLHERGASEQDLQDLVRILRRDGWEFADQLADALGLPVLPSCRCPGSELRADFSRLSISPASPRRSRRLRMPRHTRPSSRRSRPGAGGVLPSPRHTGRPITLRRRSTPRCTPSSRDGSPRPSSIRRPSAAPACAVADRQGTVRPAGGRLRPVRHRPDDRVVAATFRRAW